MEFDALKSQLATKNLEILNMKSQNDQQMLQMRQQIHDIQTNYSQNLHDYQQNYASSLKNATDIAIKQKEKEIRADAIDKSRAVIAGKVQEQLLLTNTAFEYNSKDARFIGMPIDYIVFDGLDDENLKEIVFLEVKTGKSRVNKREKMVRECIKEKRFGYKEIRL